VIKAELSKLKPQDLSNTCWAFSILGLKHKPFLAAAREQVISRCSQYTKGSQNAMTRFKGQELANSLWSLATLNYPFDGVLTQVTPYIVQICTDASTRKTTVASIANAFKRQELANLAWVRILCVVIFCIVVSSTLLTNFLMPKLIDMCRIRRVSTRFDANLVYGTHGHWGKSRSRLCSSNSWR
jgi:hypothetical protein